MKKILGVALSLCALISTAHASPNLYTSMPFLNKVAVIDTASGTLTNTLTVGTFPRAVKVSPDGTKVYVANQGDLVNTPNVEGSISVIDVASNTVSNITLSGTGNGCDFVVFSPDGSKAYVSNSGKNAINIINATNDTDTGTSIPVGERPQGLALNTDGSLLYVANQTDDTVSVINTSTNAVIATVNVGSGPSTLVVSPDGSKVYVSNTSDSTISVISTSNNSVTSFAVDPNSVPYGLLISADGNTLYVLEHIGKTLTTYNTSNNTATGSTPLTDPFLAAYNPSDGKLYASGTDVTPVTLSPLESGTPIDVVSNADTFTFGIDIVGSATPGSSTGGNNTGGNNNGSTGASSSGCNLGAAGSLGSFASSLFLVFSVFSFVALRKRS